MRHFLFLILCLLTYQLAAQPIDLPGPPDFLRTPYATPYTTPDLTDSVPDQRIDNSGFIFPLLPLNFDRPQTLREDIDRQVSLLPLRDYLRATAVINPRDKKYNGPVFTLDNGYSIRQTTNLRWQLFNAKLRPRGDAFDRLPVNQPFKNQFLACDRDNCQLLNDRGKPIAWAKEYDLMEFASYGHLIYLKNGRLGLLSSDGKEQLPPVAISVSPHERSAGAQDSSYLIRLESHNNTWGFLPDIDLLFAGEYFSGFINDHYVTTGNNVFNVKTRRYLLPEGADVHIMWLDREAGILRIMESRPKLGVYPGKDSLSFSDGVVHIVHATGEHITSVWAKYAWFDPAPASGLYVTTTAYGPGKDPYGRPAATLQYYDQSFQPVPAPPAPDASIYLGPDSLEIVENDFYCLILSQSNDTLLYLRNEVNFFPIGNDTVLVTQRLPWSPKPQDKQDGAYIFDVRHKEIIDTLPYLQQLKNGDFVGRGIHLDRHLKPLDDLQRLQGTKTEDSEQLVYPHSEKACCRAYHHYRYDGSLVVDDFGNNAFRMPKAIANGVVLLDPRGQKGQNLDYNVLSVAGQPDVKINNRFVQGYPLGFRGLLGFHFPEVCGGTAVMHRDGRMVLDTTIAFVNRYLKPHALLSINFGINYYNQEFLTYNGDWLFPEVFKRVTPQNNGEFTVQVGKMYGLYDRQGEILPPVFSRLDVLSGNVYNARLPGDKRRYLVRNGRLLN